MALPALLALIPAIFSGLANIGVKYMERKQIEAQGKVDLAKARIDAEKEITLTEMQGDQQYDVKIAEDMESSWKDEWFVILLSIPAVLCFTGSWGATTVREGFTALSGTPEWYQWAFLGAIVASFGLKSIVRPLLKKWFGVNGNGNGHAVAQPTDER
jgi:hypothetical protein